MPKVSGSSIATPEGGPTPGSAPIRMPTSTPATAIMRLNGVSATPNPMPEVRQKIHSIPSGIGTRSQCTNTSQLKPAAASAIATVTHQRCLPRYRTRTAR